MFAMPAPASNHNNHQDYDSGTIEKKRPASLVAPESEASRKEKLAAAKFSTLRFTSSAARSVRAIIAVLGFSLFCFNVELQLLIIFATD